MTVVAPSVEAVCPRCERAVHYDIAFELGEWQLVPRGRAETPYGPVWLAYRGSLRELVTEAFYHLARHFPNGAPKEKMVEELAAAFDLTPEHAETVLLLIRDEGLLYITRAETGEWAGWV